MASGIGRALAAHGCSPQLTPMLQGCPWDPQQATVDNCPLVRSQNTRDSPPNKALLDGALDTGQRW